MDIWRFLRDGPDRRRALEGILGYYLPPELQAQLRFLNSLNPVSAIEQSGQSMTQAVDPNASASDRFAAGADVAANMAGVIAPMAIGARFGLPAAQSIKEALVGISVDDAPPPGFTAYHGSPHSFERFDMSKIGTGEGAQAYGHGLYFAENEGVARGYRDALSSRVGAEFRFADGSTFSPSPDQAIALQGAMNDGKIDNWIDWSPEDLRNPEVRQIYDVLTTRGVPVSQIQNNPGSMYEVRINADPETFLDWDAPLSEQPPAVAAAIRAKIKEQMPWLDDGTIPDMAGQELYSALGYKAASDNSAALRDAGIPGIRYLDAGSRGAGEGTRNYVVFDDNLISIVRRYGVAGAAMLLGVNAQDVEAAIAANSPGGVMPLTINNRLPGSRENFIPME